MTCYNCNISNTSDIKLKPLRSIAGCIRFVFALRLVFNKVPLHFRVHSSPVPTHASNVRFTLRLELCICRTQYEFPHVVCAVLDMFDIATPDWLGEYRMTHPVEAMERMQHGDRECTVVRSKVDHTASYGEREEGLPFFIGLGSV